MPGLGPGPGEGKIVAWRHPAGARVERGDVLLVVEIDKAEVEVEAPVSGFVRHRYVEAGDLVRSGALVGAMTGSADEPFDAVELELEDMMP